MPQRSEGCVCVLGVVLWCVFACWGSSCAAFVRRWCALINRLDARYPPPSTPSCRCQSNTPGLKLTRATFPIVARRPPRRAVDATSCTLVRVWTVGGVSLGWLPVRWRRPGDGTLCVALHGVWAGGGACCTGAMRRSAGRLLHPCGSVLDSHTFASSGCARRCNGVVYDREASSNPCGRVSRP